MHRDLASLVHARPSFGEGVGRLIDFTGSLDRYDAAAAGAVADRVALMADWYAVGDDLRRAMIAHAKLRTWPEKGPPRSTTPSPEK